ncbi:MAG TPA: hypothetical protein VGI33_15400 [Paenibacillus sp.]
MQKIEIYTDRSFDTGIVVEEAYALPLNFYRKERYIQKIWGQQRFGWTIHPCSGQLSTGYICQA